MTRLRCTCCGTERPSKKARICRVCGVPALWREETAREKAERAEYEAQRPAIEALLQELLGNKPKAEALV